jgi:hypothetical protein
LNLSIPADFHHSIVADVAGDAATISATSGNLIGGR